MEIKIIEKNIVYKNKNNELKQEVKKLINILIEKGSSVFWDLKVVIDKSKKIFPMVICKTWS